MRLIRKLQRHLLKLLILTAVLSFFIAPAATVHAGFWEEAGKLFKTGEQGLSFTQYEGQLAELNPDGYDTALVSSTDLKGFVIRIVNFALGFLGLIAVIIIIYAGVLYVTAGGEDERTGTAKKAITYAVIGLLIVMGSFAFVNTVIKGAGGGADGDVTIGGGTGKSGSSFNASAEQVRALAAEIFNGFKFLAETTEEVANIQNDALKESINPDNLPSKTSILNFLISVQGKLNNIKSKLPPFTIAEARINELLRDIAIDIDKIQLKTSIDFIKIEGGVEDICSPSDDDISAWEELKAGYHDTNAKDAYCREKDYTAYTAGLYDEWKEIRLKYISAIDITRNPSSEPTLYAIIKPIANDYSKQLREIFIKLDEIYAEFQNIAAVRDGRAKQSYDNMGLPEYYGYELDKNDPNKVKTKEPSTEIGLLQAAENWTLAQSSDIDIIGGYLIQGLQQQSILYEELVSLQFVQARLSANVVEGSAPLTVVFDTVGSSDPAGGSITGENNNIIWDIGGSKKISDLFNYDPEENDNETTIEVEGNGITCDLEVIPDGESQEKYIGKTSKLCVFDHPGTYTAAVKINSNDPSKYAPGISVLTIKVRPPTNKIELNIQAGNVYKEIMHYDNDLLKSDLRAVRITMDDVKKGLILDAGSTKTISKYKWTISNGFTTESSDGRLDLSDEIKKPGKYEVTLEVTNELGVTDRKIFTLEVGSIAASLKANPSDGAFIGQNVILDASESHSDLGKIASYEWTITAKNLGTIAPGLRAKVEKDYPFKTSGANLRTLTHQFKYQMAYDIQVIVSDGQENDTIAIPDYQVKSKPPIALFDYTIPEPTQPATVHLDGSTSFDPDNADGGFRYVWSIKPEGKFTFVDDAEHGPGTPDPIVKFLAKGDYEVTLKVVDNLKPDEFTELKKKITIKDVLDIAWDPAQEVTAIVASEGENKGKAHMDFKILSDNAIAYEIDFGDGNTDGGDVKKSAIVPHDYLQAGKYMVKVTVYDQEDNANIITRHVFIGGGDKPVAKISVKVNDALIQDFSTPLKITKHDILAFDANESKNIDGTGRDLLYSWDFGDTGRSSSKLENHKYKELSPLDPGYYTVRLTVTDKDDAKKTDTDEIQIDVVNATPKFSTIQGIPVAVSGELITPVTVQIKAYGAEDADGEVTQYKWWYFDIDDPSEPLGIQITTTPSAQLIIGTRGKNGAKVTYGFGLEVVDSDNLRYSPDYQSMDEDQISKVEVINGPNELPVAKFSVNATKAFVGDKVVFSSSSTDPDGQIKSYVWDTEGDGFYNNAPSTKASYEYTYTQKSSDGYNVRLKVVDDKGGESISQPIRIYIDSLAKAPIAAFGFKVVEGSEGKKVKFTNNSSADAESGASIISHKWDFDTNTALSTSDSDGDGIMDNDVDSQAKDPERLFINPGSYSVKLTVTDDQGNSDQVINLITIPLSLPPTAAFTYKVVDGKVIFKNNSTPDSAHGAKIDKHLWDFDTDSKLADVDSDGDGNKANDTDSADKEPSHEYKLGGIYKVKLQVVDNYGNKDEVINNVDTNLASPDDSSGDSDTFEPDDKDVLETLRAILSTDPPPSDDGAIYLNGETGTVKFDFTKSIGTIAYYIIDKNIYFDTDGNGTKNDDEDFKTVFPGTWTTNFDEIWGKTTAKLTVKDIYGNEHSVNQDIKFK